MTLVYSKALKLRNTKLPIGEIVNMVSTDSQKVLGKNFIFIFIFII